MNKTENIRRLLQPGVIAIIRADSAADVLAAAKALAAGGVTAMEVTMTTPGAIQAISEVAAKLADRMLIGVGSVLDAETARLAILAGAEFVVTPVVRLDVIRLCNRYGKPIASGAFTATEALTAHEAGSDFIKIFPADQTGPAYIRNLLAPLPMLQIIPTGGISADNAAAYLKAGCVALGVGSSLVSKEILAARDWAGLEKSAAALVKAAKAAREGG